MMKRTGQTPIYTLAVVLLVVSPLLAWTGLSEPNSVADQGLAARSELYREAQRAMDLKDWATAEELFGRVAAEGSTDADAALYWRAYAQVKRGRHSAALKTLTQLERSYPESTWIDDARALEIEAKPATERELSTLGAGDEELKLYALNSLMQVEAERALPILDAFLAGNHSMELKEKALFVLSQSGSPEAREILTQVATGSRQPELARNAIEYLGLSGGAEAGELLQGIYDAAGDRDLKEQALEGLMLGGHRERVLAVARQETDPELRSEAVELLGVMGARSELRELYDSETSTEVKQGILEGLFIAGDAESLTALARQEADSELRLEIIEYLGLVGSDSARATLADLYSSEREAAVKEQIVESFYLASDSETLLGLAQTETDPELRQAAIEALGLIGNEESSAALQSLWARESDGETRRAILEAFFLQNNAGALIDIVRTESDRELRQEALEWLSHMDSDEAIAFLLDALEK